MSRKKTPPVVLAPPRLARVCDYVEWHAELSPWADALVLGETRITYQALQDSVTALASAFKRAGIRPGDRIATMSPPHPDFTIAFLAAMSTGAIWVGLNPRYRLAELAYVLRDAEPSLLLTRTTIGPRNYTADLQQLQAEFQHIRFVSLDANDPSSPFESYAAFLDSADAPGTPAGPMSKKIPDRDPCIIVYTSGSTGRPKGALLTHEALVEFSLVQNRLWPVSHCRVLNHFPINHVGCVVDISCPALISGGCIVFLEQFDADAALSLMVSERISFWVSLPTIFQTLLSLPQFAKADLSAVELIAWEGAAMPEELIHQLLKVCPRLATNYGLTETTGAVTLVSPTDKIEALIDSIGIPMPGVEMRLADATGQSVPEGQAGEIQVRSLFNMIGYWRRDTESSETILDGGWLRTGDLGVRRPDGAYRLVGRLKEMYKSGGYNIYPREIEIVIEQLSGVEMAAVVGVSDPRWQEIGFAFVVAHPSIDADQLDRHCRVHLANYKVPKCFVSKESLPLLPIGKVDKTALRQEAAMYLQQRPEIGEPA